jgi:hypothetical protein
VVDVREARREEAPGFASFALGRRLEGRRGRSAGCAAVWFGRQGGRRKEGIRGAGGAGFVERV